MPLKIIGCGRSEPEGSIFCAECTEIVGKHGCTEKRKYLKHGFVVKEE